jgi:lipopolysaccharide/colanic/teichoic acid biosynthesis glycosyltransferase
VVLIAVTLAMQELKRRFLMNALETRRAIIAGYNTTSFELARRLRTTCATEARVNYDLDHLRHWSPLLDIEILLLTIVRVFRDDKAY